MGIIEYFSEFGVSSLFGRPYRVSRLLFLIFSLIFIGAVAYLLYFNPHHYLYQSCPNSTADFCKNSAYGTPDCLADDVKDKPVCSLEQFPLDHSKQITYFGDRPPVYIEYYTYFTLGLYIIVLLINTLLFNRHLFHKPLADEVAPKDLFVKLFVNDDGSTKEIIKDESIKDKVEDREGKDSIKELPPEASRESGESGDGAKDESSKAGGSKDGYESHGVDSRIKTRSRFR